MGLMERRAAARYPLDLPIIVRREKEVLRAKTRNISTGGIYFTTDRRLTVDDVLDFSLTFVGLLEGADVLVRGQARVLRLVQRPGNIPGRVGVAAVIKNFNILRPDQL
jgi:PilZ domain